MKFWKAFGLAALTAALVPYKVEKDQETNAVTLESLLLRVKAGKNEEDGGTAVDVELLPLINRSEEEPEPAFADGDPFAGEDDEPVIEAAEAVKEAVQETVEEAAEAVQDAAAEVEKAVEEAKPEETTL